MTFATIFEVVQVPKEVAERLKTLQSTEQMARIVFVLGFIGAAWFAGMMALASILKPYPLIIVWLLVLAIPSIYAFPLITSVIRERKKIYTTHGWSGRTPVLYSIIET